MITRNINIPWLNHNANRRYPVTNDASAQDVSGTFELPDDFIVELYLAVHSGLNVDPGSFHLKSIGVFSTGCLIVVGYTNGSGETFSVASALVPRTGHARNDVYRLSGIGDYVDTYGYVVIGKFNNLDQQPPGQWTFDLDGGRLEVDAIRPFIRGVSSLRVRNGSDLSDRIYGDVILRAGTNMRITPVSSGSDTAIVFDAIEGEGLNEECVCDGEDTGEPIYTINGISPTPDGDFSLLGSTCVELEEIDHGLRITNPCAEPCCGCEELETVTQALEMFGRQATTLENFLVGLEAKVTQMDQSVLGSRLGDRGCNSCDT